MQRHYKHVPAAENTHTIIEILLETVFYVLRIISKDSGQFVLHKTYCFKTVNLRAWSTIKFAILAQTSRNISIKCLRRIVRGTQLKSQ
jgi:hypothetical protein